MLRQENFVEKKHYYKNGGGESGGVARKTTEMGMEMRKKRGKEEDMEKNVFSTLS